MIETWMQGSERVLSALGNGMVQGLFVASVAWLILRLLRRSNAATRYAVQFVALLVVVALPVIEFVREGVPGSSVDEDLFRLTPSAEGDTEPSVVGEDSAQPDSDSQISVDRSYPIVPVEDTPAMGSSGSPLGALPEGVAGLGPVTESGEPGVTDTGSVWDVLDRSRREGWEVTLPRAVVLGLVLVWGVVASVRVVRLAVQCVSLRRLKASGVDAPEEVVAVFDELLASMPVRRRVALRVVEHAVSPMLVGFRRPAVLVPSELCRAEGVDWERVLRHELAHLCRADDWTNLFQQVARAILFFHPAVLWLSRRLTVDREIACDDHVLSATGSPRAYALFLTEFARRTRGPVWAAAPGAWSNPSQLTERITMLLDTRRNASPRLAPVRAGVWTAALLLVTLLGVSLAPRLALAGTSTDAVTAGEDEGLASPPKSKPEAATTTVPAAIPVPAVAPAPALPPTPPAPAADISVLAAPPASVAIDSHADHAPRHARLVRSSGGSSHVFVTSADGGKPKVAIIRDGKSVASAGTTGTADVTVTLSGSDADESMERRLQRLEKLVAELQKNPARSAGTSVAVVTPKPPRAKPTPEGESYPFRFDGMSKVLEEVNQAVSQATREAERAARDAEKAARLAIENERKGVSVQLSEDHARVERDARMRELQAQRRVLQKQIAALESQLGRLEGQLDRLGDHVDEQVESEAKALAREQARAERLKQRAMQQKERVEAERRKSESGAASSAAEAKGASSDNAPEKGEKRKSKDKSGEETSEDARKP